MGALDAFYSTWSDARETFGQGTPQDGGKLDNSSQLMQMKAGVEAAAPDGRWQGPASEAYGAKNKEHAGVYGKLAELDIKMAAEVTKASNVVTTGRQSLEDTKSWVDGMVKALPSGLSTSDRENKLLSIANQGIGQVSNIVTNATNDMTTISQSVQSLKGRYDAIANGKPDPGENTPGEKPGEKPDILGAWQDRKSDSELLPEDMEGLVHDALNGNQEAAAKVDNLLDSIDEDQLGPKSVSHPLSPLQAELVGQMQAQMKPMSMEDIDKTREKLGPHKDILSNAMQVMSDPDVIYPRHDGDGPQVVTPGKIPNDGVLPGDQGALPDGVQAALKAELDLSGPAGGSGRTHPYETPFGQTHAAQELKALAGIISDGDPRFQQGSALDRALMARADDILDAEGSKRWGDETVQRIFESAGRDTVVSHDMITTDKDFVHDVLTHEWLDDGKSASTLTNWIDEAAYSTDPDVNRRAGETASALADYLGDPNNKQTLMDINASQQNISLGKLNPDLAQSLAHAMTPYVDDMAGRNLDGTLGFTSKDGDTNLRYPQASQVMGVLGTDDNAAKILDTRAGQVQAAYIGQYADSVINSGGQFASTDAMQAAGRLKGIWDQGAFMSYSDIEHDAAKARQDAWDRMERNYDSVKDIAGSIPYIGTALAVESNYLKDAVLGPRPESAEFSQTPIKSSIEMKAALASAFVANGIGNPVDIERLMGFDQNKDGRVDVPPWSSDNGNRGYFNDALSNYYNNLDRTITGPLDAYDTAYKEVVQ
ncbi:EspA/EspE family type VII secretion system effector [Mycolicibacterium mageritense]|uniref:TPR repeat region-containing protein n=1 Tax=Mycolicibacterium mageritense TaxID=53462 RepID=UPI0023F4346C|nr:EspA/EspE family type VII secretion system effector [Mycolicibacterium mageritense]